MTSFIFATHEMAKPRWMTGFMLCFLSFTSGLIGSDKPTPKLSLRIDSYTYTANSMVEAVSDLLVTASEKNPEILGMEIVYNGFPRRFQEHKLNVEGETVGGIIHLWSQIYQCDVSVSGSKVTITDISRTIPRETTK